MLKMLEFLAHLKSMDYILVGEGLLLPRCDEHTVQKQMRVASVDTVHRYASLDKKRLAKATEKLFSK